VKPEPKVFKVKPEPKVFKVNLEEQGIQGKPGLPGRDGAPGFTFTIDRENGSLIISDGRTIWTLKVN
jgi:hypothetical protein